MVSLFWQKFDLYAPSFSLRFKNKKNYKSKVGLTLGIISIILFFYFFLDGILSIVLRESFFIIDQIQYPNKPKTNFSNIPILFSLKNKEDKNNYAFNSSVFNITLSLVTSQYIDGDFIESKIKIPLIKCSDEYFLKKYNDFFDFKLLNEYLCPNYTDDSFFLEGDYSEGGIVKYLSFDILVCNDNCIDKNQINDLINNMRLYIFVKINYLDYNNFKNPIKHYYKDFVIELLDIQSKDFSYFFYQKNFTTDNGLIKTRLKQYSLFDYYYSENNLLEFNNKYYFKARFYSLKRVISIYRNYKKFPEMFGEIGGTCNVIFSVVNIIASYLLRNIICEDIINYVIKKNIEMKNEKKSETNSFFTNLNNNIHCLSNQNLNKFVLNSSKSNQSFLRNYFNYSHFNNAIDKLFIRKEKIKLKWEYHLFPLEYCIKNHYREKFKKYKEHIYSVMSLEKLFEFDNSISFLYETLLNSLIISKNISNKKILNFNMTEERFPLNNETKTLKNQSTFQIKNNIQINKQ